MGDHREPSPKDRSMALPTAPAFPFSGFREFYRTCLDVPAVDGNGKLNPALLWLGQYGYWVQSQKFGIPDAWGVCSRGNGRLQVAQVETVFVLLFLIIPLVVGYNLLAIGVSIKMGLIATPLALIAVSIMALVLECIVPEARISMERLEAATGLSLDAPPLNDVAMTNMTLGHPDYFPR